MICIKLSRLYLAGAIVATAIGFLFFCLLIFMWKRIRFVVAIFHEVQNKILTFVPSIHLARAVECCHLVHAPSLYPPHRHRRFLACVLCFLAHCLRVPLHLRHSSRFVEGFCGKRSTNYFIREYKRIPTAMCPSRKARTTAKYGGA